MPQAAYVTSEALCVTDRGRRSV